LIDANPLLRCFESLVCTLEGWAKGVEGYVDDSREILLRGQQLAEMHDDPLYKYLNLINQQGIMQYINVRNAIELGENLYILAQNLGVPYFIPEVLNDTGIAYEAAGEYDQVLECRPLYSSLNSIRITINSKMP